MSFFFQIRWDHIGRCFLFSENTLILSAYDPLTSQIHPFAGAEETERERNRSRKEWQAKIDWIGNEEVNRFFPAFPLYCEHEICFKGKGWKYWIVNFVCEILQIICMAFYYLISFALKCFFTENSSTPFPLGTASFWRREKLSLRVCSETLLWFYRNFQHLFYGNKVPGYWNQRWRWIAYFCGIRNLFNTSTWIIGLRKVPWMLDVW